MEVIKDLIPVKALNKLKSSIGKKYIIISGEPGLLKSELIEKFISETKIPYERFILKTEDKKTSYFLQRLSEKLIRGEAESLEGMKNSLINFFREEKDIKLFIFERFEEIKGSETESLFWNISINSNPEISFLLETREEIKTPLETQTERIDRNYLLLTEEEVIDFLIKNNITFKKRDIEKILSKTGGHGLFTRIFLSEYLSKNIIPEKIESDYIENILKEKFMSLEPDKKSLVMGISCLERFKKEELERIFGLKEPEKFIDEITKKFLFVEKAGDYYYLNPLFREYLQKELEKSPKGLMLKKWILDNAIEYYLEKEDFFQALFYLEKLKFYSKILDILSKKFFDILETNRALEIEPILDKLPEELRQNFLIILIKAQIYLLEHKFEEILKELEKIDINKLEPLYLGVYYYLKGAALYYLSNYEEAEKNAYNGLLYKEKIENRILYRLNNLLGAINSMKENLEEAEKFYEEALKIAKNIKISKRGLSILLTNLGSIYLRRGEYELAEKNYKEALSYTVDEDLIAYTLGWLSQSYFYSGNIEKTLITLNEMKKSIEKSKSYYYLNTYYTVLRDYYVFMENFEEAYSINEKLKEIYEEYKDPEIIFDMKLFESFYNLINCNTEKALEIALSLQTERKILENEKNILLAKIYFKKEEYERAEEYFKKGIEICKENIYRQTTYRIPYFLYLYYTKQFDKAENEFKIINEKIKNTNSLLFYIRFNLKTFPVKIDEEKIFNFLKEKNLI
ncbi:MAG: tetratricopeptide repeat protein [candidate division WOR-3 bacterium]